MDGRDPLRTLQQRWFCPDHASVIGDGRDHVAKSTRGVLVVPRTDRHVAHFVEGELECQQRMGRFQELHGRVVVVVVGVLGGEQDTGIDEPASHLWGRCILTRSDQPDGGR